jgi:hypothetical protein
MKPTHHISSNQPPFRGESRSSRAHRSFPLTDYCFQSNAEVCDSGRTFPNKANALRRFRQLSSEFAGAETSRYFVTEILLFSVIASLSAWPIVSMMRELARMLK